MATRREVLQGLIVSLGGAAALTACGGAANVVATRPGAAGRFHSEREMALLARVSELIIPRTETPGALDVNVPGYIDGLMSDWANADTQQRHRQALTALDRDLSQRASADYLTVDANQAGSGTGRTGCRGLHRQQRRPGRLPPAKGLYHPVLFRHRRRRPGRTEMGRRTGSLGPFGGSERGLIEQGLEPVKKAQAVVKQGRDHRWQISMQS